MNKIIQCTVNSDDIEIEDSGQAKIFTAVDNINEDSDIFVRIQSWNEDENHNEFHQLINKRIKITIETID
jgi:5'(3')-deoxyribonucleotidase